MQIREISLKELDFVYDLLHQFYTDMSYNEFDDLIYDMQHINYKMIGIIDKEILITYAGVAIQTTFKDKRHLKVFELFTDKRYDTEKYNTMMKEYLHDYANMGMCKTVLYT